MVLPTRRVRWNTLWRDAADTRRPQIEKERKTMIELKKCPFCDGEAVIRNGNFSFMVTIACQDCGAEIRVISEENAVEKAVEKWNRRTGD